MKELQRRPFSRPDRRRFARSQIDAGAAFDVVALGIEPDAALAVHQINELMPIDAFRFERFPRFQPANRAVHIVRAAQALGENFSDVAMAGGRLFGKCVGIDECE